MKCLPLVALPWFLAAACSSGAGGGPADGGDARVVADGAGADARDALGGGDVPMDRADAPASDVASPPDTASGDGAMCIPGTCPCTPCGADLTCQAGVCQSAAACAPGECIYVAQSTMGASDGSNCANAHPVTWFNDPSQWGTGAGQIGPGITVHLCGTFTGTANGTMLAFQGDGTASHPITAYFEPGAVMTAPYWKNGNVPHSGAIDIDGRSYVIIDGGSNGRIENTANGTTSMYQAGSLAISAGDCSYCEIRNLTIANIYVRSGIACEVDQTGVRAIDFGGTANHVTVDHNVIHDVGWAINEQATGEVIAYNEIYNVDHGIVVGSTGPAIGGIVVHDNHIHDYALWDTTPETDCYHHDGIHGFGSTSGVITDITIYDNLFDGETGANFNQHVFLEGTADGTPWTSSPDSVNYVFNNVFSASTTSESITALGGIGGNGVFVNNTVVGHNPTYTSACVGFGDTSDATPGATVENNAIEGCGILVSGEHEFVVAAFDYNAYADCMNYNCWFTGFTDLTIDVSSFSTWQTMSRWDAHGLANIGSTTYFDLDATFRPGAGSPLIAAGANLTSLCTGALAPLCTDRAGNPRPATGAWDIGANQY